MHNEPFKVDMSVARIVATALVKAVQAHPAGDR